MRKVNRNRTGNKSRLYYIFGIVAICAFVSIGIGYSILTSTVRIDGTASITSTWKIVFTKAVENTMNEATTTSGPSITAGTTLDIGVELNKKGSQAIYDVTVQNQGTIDAVVKEIRLNDGEPTDLKVYISGLYKGFALKAGESKQFQVIAEWSASAPESSETEKNVNVSVDFEQETEGSEKPELSMPTYTVDYPNEVWTKEKNVTMTYPEGEDLLYQYSTDGGKTWLIAPSRVYVLKFTTEGTLYIRVSDGVSVLTTPLITIDKIDTTAPEVQVNGNNSEWTTSKTLTINASDKESGLATNPYSWDGGNSWTSVKEKEFTSNQTVNIWVKDNAGNINKQSVTISKIDNQAPTNVTLKEGLITSSSISVTANATQTGGGIKGYQFSINNGTWSSEQTSATKTFTGLTKNTSYQIKVRVIANNGKYTDSSNITIKTNDITVPTYSVVDDGPNFTKEVTINYPDVKTINLVYEYSTDGGKSWMAIGGTTTTITFTEDGSVIARVRDTGNNNNTVTASTLTIQFPINMLIDGLRLGSIEYIRFVDYSAEDAGMSDVAIDVSAEQNNSIQMWYLSEREVNIGSKRKIYANTDSSYLFTVDSGTNYLRKISFNDYFDVSEVEDMSYMFYNMESFIYNYGDGENSEDGITDEYGEPVNGYIDISHWDTSNVTNMSHMFDGCVGSVSMAYWDENHDLASSIDTSNVTDMSYMFANTRENSTDTSAPLSFLDIDSDTSKVTNMSHMFYHSIAHGEWQLDSTHGFSMQSVEDASYMFAESYIQQIRMWTSETSKLKNMEGMFANMPELLEISFTDMNTSNVTNMSHLFDGTSRVKFVDETLLNLDTSNVTDISYMLRNVKDSDNSSNTVSFTVGSKVKNYTGFVDGSDFKDGTRALHLYDDGTKAGYDLVEKMVTEFGSDSITHSGVLKDGLTLLNLNRTGWLPSNVEYVQFVTIGPNSSDTTVDLSKDDDGTVLGWQRSTTYFVYRVDKKAVVANPNSSWLFGGMADQKLKTINTVGFLNTVNVTNFANMFAGRMALTSVDLQHFDTSNATNFSFMFSQCTALKTLNASTLDFDGVTNTISMFSQATNLTTTLTVKGNTITSYNNMFGQNAAQNGKITVKGDGTNSSLITKLIGTSTNGKVVAG